VTGIATPVPEIFLESNSQQGLELDGTSSVHSAPPPTMVCAAAHLPLKLASFVGGSL